MEKLPLYIIITSIAIFAFFTIPVYGLENNIDYVLSGENTFIVISTGNENADLSIIDGGISVNDEWEIFESQNIKRIRISDDGNIGKVFGATEDGNNFYIIWKIENGESEIFSKIWKDGESFKLIEKMIIDYL